MSLFVCRLFDLRIQLILLACLAITALPPYAAGQTTYYVNGSTGNDANAGTSPAPWKTIQKAANTVIAGDTVNVAAGTYAQRVTVTTSGSAGSLVTFQAQGAVVLQGFILQGSYVKVTGFEITNVPGNDLTDRTNTTGVYISGSFDEVSNNYIHGTNSDGIYLTTAAGNATISSNRVVSAVEAGLFVQGSNHLVVSNDISHTVQTHSGMINSSSNADGIFFFGTGSTFRKNNIHDITAADAGNSSPSINIFQTWGPCSNMTIEQNTMWQMASPDQGIVIEGATQPVGSITIRNNLMMTNGTSYAPAVLAGDGGAVTNVSIVNNTIVALNGPAEYAVWLFANLTTALVKNNAIYDHGTSSAPYIRVDAGASGLDIGFNSVAKSNGQAPTGTAYPGDLWMVNPFFVNVASRDFHLQSASPLINKGTIVSAVTNDYDGVARPQGSGYDIGAFEFVNSTPPSPPPVLNPPTITSFTPTSGLVGASVTISGTNFTGATGVTFNGVSASFTVSSATAIQAAVPAGASTGPIGVTTPGGTATSAAMFTIGSGGTPPTVNITSPTSGSNVAGTISVSANASDDVGVAGVQFKLDGVNLGAEVTTAPYSISWDTTTTTLASHTLTAVARDTSGNQTTSPPVAVTVYSQTTWENQQPGSRNWNISRSADDTSKQIKGYASATSVNKGGSLNLYVSVNPTQTYAMDVYRMGYYQGLGGRLLQHIGPLNGVPQSSCPVNSSTGLTECAWTSSYVLNVPTTWTSGLFLVQLTNAQGYQTYITFAVRDDARHSDFLYQQSVTTYQAYNNYPNDGTGKSLYEYNSSGGNTVAGTPRAVKVSFNRPYSSDSGSGHFLRYEYYFISWLEQSGYDVSYSTNVDTHENSSRLLNSRAFLSDGHDEYWSKQMYDGVERARDAGIHLGFFGGDTLSWQIRFESSPSTGAADRVIVCYKDQSIDPIQGPTTTIGWSNPFINRSGQILRGVRYAGQLASSNNAAYVVQNSSHWIYAGTGLTNGASIPGIVGYEGDAYASTDPSPTSVVGTYVLLSQSPFTDTANRANRSNSSIYQALSGAWVFSSGTICWSWGLSYSGVADARIQRITTNILHRFLGIP